jgi:glycine/D-amino acid oxidase-like deaminating enzyme
VRASSGHVVVVGGGVFGATGALELRARGWAVTLLDPHPLPYHDASSTDVSKLVRMDYGSDVFYHELAEAALEGWDHWNATWPAPVFHEDGLLVLSRGPMSPGGFEHDSWRVLCERGHAPERLDAASIGRRFPAWSTGVFEDGYFNRRAGWVESRLVVERLVELGRAVGVTFVEDGFASLVDAGSHISGVTTSSGARIDADRVVVCAGAWTPAVLPWLSDRLRTVAQPVLRLRPVEPEPFLAEVFPPWAAGIASSGWYGFPASADGTVKIGHHGTGEVVHPDARGEVSDEHVARVRAFLAEAVPSLADAPVVERRVCLYCDSFDGDFLIDQDPQREGLVVAAGGSGHAFKFAPLLGSMIADAVERRPAPWGERFRWRLAGAPRAEEARFVGQNQG